MCDYATDRSAHQLQKSHLRCHAAYPSNMTFTPLCFLLVLLVTKSQSTWSLSSILASSQRSTRRHAKCSARHATTTTRRQCLEQISVATTMIASVTTLVSLPSPARSAETIGKADDCNDSYCLGVWDGMLADCPHSSNNKDVMQGKASALLLRTGAGCVSSQDDTPGIFAEP
jgi:hypothetical protein